MFIKDKVSDQPKIGPEFLFHRVLKNDNLELKLSNLSTKISPKVSQCTKSSVYLGLFDILATFCITGDIKGHLLDMKETVDIEGI